MHTPHQTCGARGARNAFSLAKAIRSIEVGTVAEKSQKRAAAHRHAYLGLLVGARCPPTTSADAASSPDLLDVRAATHFVDGSSKTLAPSVPLRSAETLWRLVAAGPYRQCRVPRRLRRVTAQQIVRHAILHETYWLASWSVASRPVPLAARHHFALSSSWRFFLTSDPAIDSSHVTERRRRREGVPELRQCRIRLRVDERLQPFLLAR